MKDFPIFKYRCVALVIGFFVVSFIVGIIQRIAQIWAR